MLELFHRYIMYGYDFYIVICSTLYIYIYTLILLI